MFWYSKWRKKFFQNWASSVRQRSDSENQVICEQLCVQFWTILSGWWV